MPLRKKEEHKGFTLVEVMIAMVILAIVTLALVSTMTGASMATRRNGQALTAKNIVQSYFESMAIDAFSNVNSTKYPNVPMPSPPYNMGDPGIVWIDKLLQIPGSVTFTFKGFGTATNGSTTSLTDGAAAWQTNEWAGDTLFIVNGSGSGQFAQIQSNTSTLLTLASALSVAPAAGSKYMINGGKTVTITIAWSYRGKAYQQTVASLIVQKNITDSLGF